MNSEQNSLARLLAPIALVAAFLAVILVLATSGGSDDSGKHAGDNKNGETTTQVKKVKKTYIVKEGDSLSIIAEKTGVPVDKLSALNAELDPQALITGTCVSLRTASDCGK